jgi:hypothetical protein
LAAHMGHGAKSAAWLRPTTSGVGELVGVYGRAEAYERELYSTLLLMHSEGEFLVRGPQRGPGRELSHF